MIQPDNLDPVTMEYAAQLVESDGRISDVAGIMAKKKRVREDAQLRMEVRKEQRQEIARYLRAMTNRDDLSAISILRRITETPEAQHHFMVRDAWPLAWKGWVDIEAITKINSNSIPASVIYRITITEKGQQVLDEEKLKAQREESGYNENQENLAL